jgi:pimeloyl-ACP methyl ester carboxylesterase
VFRSFPLTKPNPAVEQAVVVIHGASRNADSYFLSAVAGALIAGALGKTVVVAPRLASNSGNCRDKLEPGEISWNCGGEQDWRRGGSAADAKDLYAFDLIDEILRKLARAAVFPNLKAIVVTGHSAGGQVTNRYAAANRVEPDLRAPVKYVVSNPSSYLYLDAARLPSGACSDKGGCTGEFDEYTDGENCVTYDNWHYGMKNRAGYAASIPDERIRTNLISRDVTYLLGSLDTLPLFGFDSSCPAMAQGSTRLARGITYWNYINSRGARHKLVTVPACGHNGRCMYTADESLAVLFPK